MKRPEKRLDHTSVQKLPVTIVVFTFDVFMPMSTNTDVRRVNDNKQVSTKYIYLAP